MLDINLVLFNKARAEGAKDSDVIKCIADMFHIAPEELTEKKLNLMFQRMSYGEQSIDMGEVTKENRVDKMKEFLKEVYDIFDNDENHKDFYYSDGKNYHSLRIADAKKPSLWQRFAHAIFGAYKAEYDNYYNPNMKEIRDAMNSQPNVVGSNELANSLNNTAKSEMDKTAKEKVVEYLGNPEIDKTEKKQIMMKVALYEHSKWMQPMSYYNDVIMFSNKAARNMSKEQRFIHSTHINKELTGKKNGVISQIGRVKTRTNCVRLIMLSKGMSLNEVFSDDPKYDKAKREAGRELMDILDKKDKLALLKILPKAAEQFDKITFPNKNASTVDKMAFFYQNNLAITLAQDMVQLFPDSEDYKNLTKDCTDAEKQALDKVLRIGTNIASYGRATSQFVSKLTSDSSVMTNKNIIMPGNAIGDYEAVEYFYQVFDGKHPSEINHNDMNVLLRMRPLLTPPYAGPEGEDDEQVEYAHEIMGHTAEQLVNKLNLDVKKYVDDVYEYIGKKVPDEINNINLKEETPFSEKYVALDDVAIITTNKALTMFKGAQPIVNAPYKPANQNELNKSLEVKKGKEILSEKSVNIEIDKKELKI